MTMLKKTLLASAAIAVMTGLVGCGDDPVAPAKKPGGDTTVTDTYLSKTIRPIGGWSDISGEGGAVTYDSTGKATNDTSFVVTLKRPKNPNADTWPSAIAVGAITEVNLEGVSAFVLEYTVNSVNAPTGEVSGVNFGIATVDDKGEFQIDREESTTKKWYGSFVSTLTTGTDKKGEKQTDTIWVDNSASSSMYLSYCGNSLADKDVYEALNYENPTAEAEGDLILLKENQQVLETTAGVFLHLAHGTDESEDEVKLTVHSLKALAKDQATIDKIK